VEGRDGVQGAKGADASRRRYFPEVIKSRMGIKGDPADKEKGRKSGLFL
jgi:hypothetical protein